MCCACSCHIRRCPTGDDPRRRNGQPDRIHGRRGRSRRRGGQLRLQYPTTLSAAQAGVLPPERVPLQDPTRPPNSSPDAEATPSTDKVGIQQLPGWWPEYLKQLHTTAQWRDVEGALSALLDPPHLERGHGHYGLTHQEVRLQAPSLKVSIKIINLDV